MNAYYNNDLVFMANVYFETAIQAFGLAFTSSIIPQIDQTCRIIKRKNHS